MFSRTQITKQTGETKTRSASAPHSTVKNFSTREIADLQLQESSFPKHWYSLASARQFADGEDSYGSVRSRTSFLPLLPLQAKLHSGTVDDPLEHDADRVAERIMRMPHVQTSHRSNSMQHKCACGGTCHKCQAQADHDHETAPTTPANPVNVEKTEVPSIVHEVLRSSGQPLDTATRAFMEPRFNFDFSQVRIHADGKAAESAKAVNASAYTVGQHVVLRSGQSAISDLPGRYLLAHELAHVVQQSKGSGAPPPMSPSAAHEQDARDVTVALAAGSPHLRVACNTGIGLARNEPGNTPEEAIKEEIKKVQREMVGEIEVGLDLMQEKGHERTLVREVRTKANRRQPRRRNPAIPRGDGSMRIPPAEDVKKDLQKLGEEGHKIAARIEELQKRQAALEQARQAAAANKAHFASTAVEATEPHVPAKAVVSAEAETHVPGKSVVSAEAKAGGILSKAAELPKIAALDAAFFYLDIHAPHFAALEKVSEMVGVAKNLVGRVDEFETEAREMTKVINALRNAEAELPADPLGQLGSNSEDSRLSIDELRYLRSYYEAGMSIISHAFDANVKLSRIIEGWNTVVAKAEASKDFTRGAVWDAITQLDLRFSTGGQGFLHFLTDARDWTIRIDTWVRYKLREPSEIACVKESDPIEYATCLLNQISDKTLRP